MADNLLFSSIRVGLLQLGCMLVAAFTSFYKIFFIHENEMPLHLILPFIDPDTQQGFYINLANQFMTGCGGIFIVTGSEITVCLTL